MNEYKTTVGIEVHAELHTKSKMFCGCPNNPHDAEPNTNVCPVCTAHPGTLPVVNKAAVEAVLKVGKAIGGTLADYSEFDRKNYFYPDIPKAYQISQYAYPLVTGGSLAGVAVTRIHLEEDTARSQHDKGGHSLVDFNRAGVPLMELVTEPVIHDPESAGAFARELQLLLRTLEVSHANMERGEMRVEANISVSKDDTLGTKVEVKNLNSFKSVELAVAYETKRQIAALANGEKLVQETRGWDEEKLMTYSQRVKESSDDYRYFPDPDIPKLKRSAIEEFSDSRIAENLPKLATDSRSEYRDLGLTDETIETLLANRPMHQFFEMVLASSNFTREYAKQAANYIVSDIPSFDPPFNFASATSDQAAVFAELIELAATKQITSRVAKDLLPEVLIDLASPKNIAKSRGLLQQNDAGSLEPVVASVIADNPSVVAEYKAGKEAVMQYLVGQGMKATRGSANPELLRKLLIEKLSS